MKKVNEEFITMPVSKVKDSPYQGRIMPNETDGTTNNDKHMKIVNIVPGFGGTFYCGNCLRDNGYTKSLRQLGHDVKI